MVKISVAKISLKKYTRIVVLGLILFGRLLFLIESQDGIEEEELWSFDTKNFLSPIKTD